MSSPSRQPPRRHALRRLRRASGILGGVIALALVVLLAAALLPGSHTGSGRFGVRVTAPGSRGADPLHARVHRVFGSGQSAAAYGTAVAEQENDGVNGSGQMISDLSPVSSRAFDRPIALYRAYAERWAQRLADDLAPLTSALRSGSRPSAQAAWRHAFGDWLRLGAVYGLLSPVLQADIAGLPPVIGQTDFAGLHRIEMGLWTGAPPRSLLPFAARLATAVGQLRRALPVLAISPLDYATRAHEILEDAQRDLLSGTQVPWSGEGVLGTAAGLAATRELIGTLTPLLEGRDDTLAEVTDWLGRLQRAIVAVRRRGGSWPTLSELSLGGRERLDGALAGTLGALELVPGTLETTTVPAIPTLPRDR